MAKPVSNKTAHTPQPPRRTIVVDGESQRAQVQNESKRLIRTALQLLVGRLERRPTEGEVDRLCRYKMDSIDRYFGDLESALAGVKIPDSAPNQAESSAQLRGIEAGGRPSRPAVVTGIQFSNSLEEVVAIADLRLRDKHLLLHPVTLKDVESMLRQQGPAVISRSWQIYRLAHGLDALPKQPPHLFWHLDLHRSGRIKSLTVSTEPPAVRSASVQQVYVDWTWHPGERQYVPAKAIRKSGVSLVDALLTHHGFDLNDVASRSMVDDAIGFKRDPIKKLDDLRRELDNEGIAAIDRLLPLARKLNPQFRGTPTAVDLSLGIMYDGTFSSLRLKPWDIHLPLKQDRVRAHLFFKREGAAWKYVQYAGQYSEWVKDVFPSTAPMNMRGNVAYTWDQLRGILAEPQRRQELFVALWRRDHQNDPFPRRYIFQTDKNQRGVVVVQQAYDLAILDAERADLSERTERWAWLRFEPGLNDGANRLAKIEGNAAGELAEMVLMGDGHLWVGPVERFLVLKTLSGGLISRSAPDQTVPTRQELVDIFIRHGPHIAQYLIATVRSADPKFPALPDVLLVSGIEKGKSPSSIVGSLSVRAGEKFASMGHSYFGVQFEPDETGHYRVTDSNQRGLGRELAKIAQSFAPDADAIEQTAETVRRLTQSPGGFAPLDAEMCRPEPLTTPAELMKVEPMVNVPVEVKRGTPGFAPTPLTPQDLAIPPSVERPSGVIARPVGPKQSSETHGIATPPAEARNDNGVNLPATIGGEVFLPEPPLGMVIAGDMILFGGIAIVAAASAIEIPAGLALGVGRGVHAGLTVGRPILAYSVWLQ